MSRTICYSLEKVEGILLGTFLGDAVGAPFDGCSFNEIPPLDDTFIKEHPPKTYTDDTQMSISVFEEMLENGCIMQPSLMRRFMERFTPWRGYSGGMLEVMELWRDGRDLDVAARSLYHGNGSFGDGAAVRASPIAAFFSINEVQELLEQVRLCSLLTHTHPYGLAGADLQAYCVLLALNEIPRQEWLPRLYSFPMESVYKIKLETIKKCLEKQLSPQDSAREIGSDADALDAIPAAIFSVLRNPDSFADAVLFSVAMGGDTDTIGAMTGALAGARSGVHGIPSPWLETLENGEEGRDFIISLVRKARH
ncbi:MAG: ADP-ribosylglycohydrolase family protein [Chitinispirillaceae bacterium]|nr:ADP-ribosylglycohydrolase family protein [Chitinispirillaceae bacterium]